MQMTVITAARRPETAQERRKSRVPALSALLLLALVAIGTTLPLVPPAPRPASAPTTYFSADRAVAHLDGIATVPHPPGSEAQARVREYLLGRLRHLGLDPEVLTRVVARSADDGALTAGTVSDVYATIAGRQPTGRVLLVAHYDSVPTGPGASDNGSNVAAILEVVRALQAGPQPRNGIGVLFTDSEELGLLGAKAFVDSGEAGNPARVVVLNLEARGVSGPAVMFQTAGTELTSAVRASGSVTTSLAVQVYQMLPNDTDLTVFHEAGMRGLNFAYVGGAGHYHTRHDDIDQVSSRSVQDMGDAALATARHLAAADLEARGSDGTYFSLFGTVVTYPGWLVLPLGGVAGMGFVVLLWLGRRRGLSLGGVARAGGTFPLCLLAATVVGWAGLRAVVLVRPDFALLVGGVYHPVWYALGGAALLLVALVAWYRWTRRKASSLEVAVGVVGWFSLLALVCAALVPSAGYLFTWPALVGVAAAATALRYTHAGSAWRTVAACAFAAPALALVLPIVVLLVPLGISLTAVQLLLVILLGATVLPVLEPLPARRALTGGMVAVAVAGATSVVAVTAVDGYGRDEPRPVSLGYVLEADTAKAMWVSEGGPDQPVVGRLLTGGLVRLDDRIPQLGGSDLHTGPAPVGPTLAGAHAEVSTTEEQDGIRTMRVRITVPADAYSLAVFADTTGHQILGATVDRAPLVGGRNLPGAVGDWGWGFRYAAPPREGVDLRIRARGAGPMRMRIVTTTASLPSGAGAPTLSPGLSWASWPSVAGQTFVVTTFRL